MELLHFTERAVWEADAHGPAYPHIYGPLPTSAVVEVVPVTRDPSGRFLLPQQQASRKA
jgi:uncharacterized protein (DUF952 family)